MPLLLLLSLQACLTLPAPLFSSSIPWARKRTGASAVGDVQLEAFYLLFYQLTPPLLSSKPRAHIPLPTPPSWSQIYQVRHLDAAASVIVPESPTPRTHCLFLVLRQRLRRRRFRGPVSEIPLTFGLLNSYFFWRWFVFVTVGRTILPNLVGDDTVENSWVANWIPRLFYK